MCESGSEEEWDIRKRERERESEREREQERAREKERERDLKQQLTKSVFYDSHERFH